MKRRSKIELTLVLSVTLCVVLAVGYFVGCSLNKAQRPAISVTSEPDAGPVSEGQPAPEQIAQAPKGKIQDETRKDRIQEAIDTIKLRALEEDAQKQDSLLSQRTLDQRLHESHTRTVDALRQPSLTPAEPGRVANAPQNINGFSFKEKSISLKEGDQAVTAPQDGLELKAKWESEEVARRGELSHEYSDHSTVLRDIDGDAFGRNRISGPTPGASGRYYRSDKGQLGNGLTYTPAKPSTAPHYAITGKAHGIDREGQIQAVPFPPELLRINEDEIWIIAKAKPATAPPDEDTPPSGALLAKRPDDDREVPVPLKHTEVTGDILGYIATVEVTQQFHNPFDTKIEAVYVFPLPQNAAVNEFIMTIGDRRIRGIIRERQEAERIYQQAKRQGHNAALMTQERPNIFTQKVANLEPGKNIDINIRYFNTLTYADGWYEFVFPLVVGPRFNPPGFTDGVGAVARGKAGISGQKTEVQYLKPNERSGHDIALTVDIDAGVAIEKITCVTHVVDQTKITPDHYRVRLSPRDSIPNKDFVLRYQVAGRRVKSGLVTQRDQRGGFFTLMLYPPESLQSLKRAPMEMIFVLDCSGSMSGKPIAKAKEAILRGLKKLGDDDTFQVIRFSNNASQFGPNPVPATADNIRKAVKYVEKLRGSGGTMMIEGIKAALDFPHDPRRFRLVSFMTDGYIGNDMEIIGEVHKRLGDSRIFSFGVGSSVNRFLLDRMAKVGRGAVAYLGLHDSAAEIVDEFYDRISHPALTDVRIDWGGLEVSEVYPRRIPDLFVGRPVIVTGRFQGNAPAVVRVTGRVGNLDQEIALPVDLDDRSAQHKGIACVWARKRIEDLTNQKTYDRNPDLPVEIKNTALEYGLMSAYTAFVAVDSSRRTAGDHGVSVAVPVPVPEGVRYDTTVQN